MLHQIVMIVGKKDICMKIFIQLCIILFMIHPMVMMCSKGRAVETSSLISGQPKSGPSSDGRLLVEKSAEQSLSSAQLPLKESFISDTGMTTVIRDAQTGKLVSSKTELADGTIVHQVMDQQTGKKTSGTVTHPDGLTIGQTFDVHGKLIEQQVIDSGLTLSDKASVKNESTSVQPASSVASKSESVSTIAEDGRKIMTGQEFLKMTLDEHIKDPIVRRSLTDNTEYENFNKDVAQAFKTNAKVTQSFLSGIEWSKLIPTKTMSLSVDMSVDMISNFFKDLSLAFKQKIAEKELSPEEQDFAARNERMQIQRISKQINKITSNITEKETQLKQSEQELQAEQAKIKSNPVWIAQHEKDIAQLKKTIEQQKQQKSSLQEQQTKLMADKFTDQGRLKKMEIQRISKQINKITSNIIEKETQLKQSEQELQAEQAKIESNPVWIAQHKKDIAQLEKTIEEQKEQKSSLQEQQTKLMADKFDDQGRLIVTSASEQVAA